MGSYNDLALVEIDPADVERVNPSVPGFGGPTGVGGVEGLGSTVYSYGNSGSGFLNEAGAAIGVLMHRAGEAQASQRLLGSLAAASDPARQAGRVGRAAR